MARPGLLQHRKFKRLARSIGSIPLALGSLELLWGSCYENGDDYLGESEDVEAAAFWDGEPGCLTQAMAGAGGTGNAGFIEELQDRPGHYRVHDLYDHAPDYVQKRMAREATRITKGQTIAAIRSEAGKRGRAAQLATQTQANGGQTADTCPALSDSVQANGGQTAANGGTPAPAPAPAPSGKRRTASPPAPRPARPRKPDPESLEAILQGGKGTPTWEAYWALVTVFGGQSKNPAPRTTARLYANAVANGAPPGRIQNRAENLRSATSEVRFMPQLAKWLEGEGYLTPDLPKSNGAANGNHTFPAHRSTVDEAYLEQLAARGEPIPSEPIEFENLSEVWPE